MLHSEATYLVIHVCVGLTPGQVIAHGLCVWVAHGSSVKHGCNLHRYVWQEGCPLAHVVCREAGCHEGHQLGGAPALGGEAQSWNEGSENSSPVATSCKNGSKSCWFWQERWHQQPVPRV